MATTKRASPKAANSKRQSKYAIEGYGEPPTFERSEGVMPLGAMGAPVPGGPVVPMQTTPEMSRMFGQLAERFGGRAPMWGTPGYKFLTSEGPVQELAAKYFGGSSEMLMQGLRNWLKTGGAFMSGMAVPASQPKPRKK